MNLSVHLISAPWAQPFLPSIQTGVLSASLRVLGQPARCWPAHLTIPARAFRRLASDGPASLRSSWDAHSIFGEHVFLAALLLQDALDRDAEELTRLLTRNARRGPLWQAEEVAARSVGVARLDGGVAREFALAADEFVRDELLPALPDEGALVFGFTLNYDQVFASIYLHRRIVEALGRRPHVAVYGGSSISFPHVVARMREWVPEAFAVLGEGEAPLAALVGTLAAAPAGELGEALGEWMRRHPNVFPLHDPPDLHRRDPRWFERQLSATEFSASSVAMAENFSHRHHRGPGGLSERAELSDGSALPDYDDYFAAVDRLDRESLGAAASEPLLPGSARLGESGPDRDRPSLRDSVFLPFEGTRGCFARCDFCGLNYVFDGFRKRDAATVYAGVEALIGRYGVPRFEFVDNVCDTWAEEFAERVLGGPHRILAFMELRAHHEELFWTKLYSAGVRAIQVGVEAVSPALLRAIGKGTRAIQNVAVLKYLRELRIASVTNLITHHPRSTLADVAETRRILRLTSHLGEVSLVEFQMVVGSPLYLRATEAERRGLEPANLADLPPDLRSRAIAPMFPGLTVPPSLALPADVARAWDELRQWYFREQLPMVRRPECQLRLEPGSNGRAVVDGRDGEPRRCELSEPAARLLSELDQPRRAATLDSAALAELHEHGLVVELDQRVVSLVLRDARTLVRRLIAAQTPPPASLPGPP